MATQALLASVFHPSEVGALLRYKFLSADKTQFREVSSLPPPSDPSYSYALCYFYLNKTSRSFARVIQELDPELRHPVCLFYLVLRGLDTIEDDMTLDPALKQDLLKSFDSVIYKKGWNFDGNGSGEKDRILLERFDVVIEQFLLLKPECVFLCFKCVYV
jgi:farnesyl-diphosphate farnesyltransferase